MSLVRHLLCVLVAIAGASRASKPNIIVLILDDMDSMLGATDVMPHYVQVNLIPNMLL